MNITKTVGSVSAVLSALGIAATLDAPQAFAADSKVYPGSMCVQWAGPLFASDGITPAKGLNWSSVVNLSDSGWIYLDCPAVHDGGSIAYGSVRATDRHATLNVQCGLWGVYRDPANSAVIASTGGRQNTIGGGADAPVQRLKYGRVSQNGSLSYWFFSCAIPPTDAGRVSEIHSYYVDED